MEIYTIGFTQKSAERFFGLLREAGIRRLLDVRLNNSSQLAAFAKQDDLRYFLREILGAEYLHAPVFAPTDELLKGYKGKTLDWPGYEREYARLLDERKPEQSFGPEFFATPTVLLCSEADPERCHRRLAAEHLARLSGLSVRHL